MRNKKKKASEPGLIEGTTAWLSHPLKKAPRYKGVRGD